MSVKQQDFLNQKMKSFTFITVLGEGAFAKVYEAIDERDGSQVAIKVIPKQLMIETPKLDQLVKTQIKVLKTCSNDNVIKYIDSFTTAKSVLIGTQFCNGGDLQKYLEDKKRLTEDEATGFLKQIINGFKGLHEVGAMHRDFKLANVLLHNGICKIADLGFAKQMEVKGIAHTVLGTSLTMAPEVLQQKPYGMQADLWSIAVVYYQMIYGKYPYMGMNDYDILKKIKNNRPDFSAVKISKECRDFIDKCLTVDPKKRITWKQVYDHPLLRQSDARFIYGLKSRIHLGGNQNFYDKNEDQYPNIDEIMKKKDFTDIIWQDTEIKQSINVDKIKEDANNRKQRQANFNIYQKQYINKRNQIMFIFKYVGPFSDTLVQYKANHGIALYITAKKAYIDMKNLIEDVKKQKNIFNIKKDWIEFSKSPVYSEILRQFEGDLQMIYAQGLSYQYDIEIQSKEVEAEKNIEKVVSKNWETLVKDTVNEYWFLLAEAAKDQVPKNQTQKRNKQTLIRVLQALDYYNERKDLNVEEYDKIMEVLDISQAQEKMKVKLNKVLEG